VTPHANSITARQGYSVAISGNVAVAGAPGVSDNTGAVYVFQKTRKKGWHPIKVIGDPRVATNDDFGWSAAVYNSPSLTYVAVGGNGTNGQRDFVYVFTNPGGAWTLQSEIADPGNNSSDMFGDSVALSANTLVIGASCVKDNSGAVYIYHRNGLRWILQAHVTDPLNHDNDSFGDAVATSGDTVVVGARDRAYVYVNKTGHRWVTAAVIKNPGPAIDNFGASVGVSGSTAVVGAPGTGTEDSGAAYVYAKSGSHWMPRATLVAKTRFHGDQFGTSVTTSGTWIVVGEPEQGRTSCGQAREFDLRRGKWVAVKEAAGPACAPGNLFGFSVATSDGYLVVGSPGASKGAGAAFVGGLG
jgi:hypothetical protein